MTPEAMDSLLQRLPAPAPSPDVEERFLREYRRQIGERARKHSRQGRLAKTGALAAALLLCAIAFWAIFSPRPPSVDPRPGTRLPSTQESDLEKLVDQLGAELPEVRERAFRALRDKGEAARAVLVKASKSGVLEIRSRALELLGCLDRDPTTKKIQAHSGPLGDNGAVWVESEVFDLLSDEKALPEWMKAALVDADNLAIAFVLLDGTKATKSEVLQVRCKPVHLPYKILDKTVMRPDVQLLRGITNTRSAWWSGAPLDFQNSFTKLEEPKGGDVFRLRPAGQVQVAFVVRGTNATQSVEALFPVLVKAAVSEGKVAHRVAALDALRHYFHPEAVEVVLKALEDPRAEIREAAQGTLRVIVDAPGKSPAEVAPWWRGLKEEVRSSLLQKRLQELGEQR